ncbi:MAG: CBS domain-containing protein [Candidatus Scalindua sediminis]|nr:CBS domain-containing protein [Candidatus Scalindua sediminis]
MKEIDKYKVSVHSSIRDAIKHMDEVGMGFCVCVDDEDKVIGVITDGDFRRAVHNVIQLDENVGKIINKDFYYVQKNYDKEEVERIFNNTIVKQVPVIGNDKLLDIITEEEFLGIEKGKKRGILDNPVVIMAGGKGKRLDPFTRILPKPLIPLGNEPVIKIIMDEFYKFGMSNFYISLGDKEKMVKAYFHDHDLGYQIKYVHEGKPLGTAGALKYLENTLGVPFFVSNCDIIIHADYGSIYEFHKEGPYDLTMVGSMQQYKIPYGVCEIGDGGVLKQIREKPEYDFLVNTGFYLLDPIVLQYIPDNTYFDMTDLICKIQDNSLKIGVFPVSEKSWVDVGQWRDCGNTVKELGI